LGEVLEMIKKALSILFAVTILAGCASEPSETPEAKVVFQQLKNAIFSRKGDVEGQRRSVESLSREQFIGAATNPFILVDIESSRQYATLNLISKNGDHSVYLSADNKSMTLQHGLLTATRGMGADLMALDVGNTLAALSSTTGTTLTTRSHRSMNGENALETTVFQCDFETHGLEKVSSVNKVFSLTKITESCSGPADSALSYTNTYWIDKKSGTIWKSRQWAGSIIGYFGIDVLIPESR
jgi:hypothetical protein